MSLIVTGMLAIAKIASVVCVGRAVSKGLSAIEDRITPYEKSKAHKQAEFTAKNQKELELMRESFQVKLQHENNLAQERIAIFNRHSQMILAEKNAHSNLRHALIQDAIRNFPLNISPLVLLENNNIDISFLLGNSSFSQDDSKNLDSIFDGLDKVKPLNVFITPMHIDARINGKEAIAASVYDSVYSSLESLFVNEYSRNSERPVIFYSAAWNKNVKGGLHAADELYYFLKEMPTIVVEPRFDGNNIKLMFSCWGIGYTSYLHIRQEIQIPLDLNSMLAISVYERSKKAVETLNSISSDIKVLIEQRAKYEHNIAVFEQLGLEKRIEKRLTEIKEKNYSTELDELGDYCKLLYVNQNDIVGISDIISATTGMIISVLADTHHLMANDINPLFPYIYGKYFDVYANENLLRAFSDIYERTYLKLIQDFPQQESKYLIAKESVKKALGTYSHDKLDSVLAIRDSLIQKCTSLGSDSSVVNWSVTELINYYIDNIDNDAKYRKSLLPFLNQEQKVRLNEKLTSLL